MGMSRIHTERLGDRMVYVLSDRDAGSRVRILPDFGFNCYSFQCRVGDKTLELLHAEDGFPSGTRTPDAGGIPVLFPFPNRIREGRFVFEDTSYELPRNEPGGANAIHGLLMGTPLERILSLAHGFAARICGIRGATERNAAIYEGGRDPGGTG